MDSLSKWLVGSSRIRRSGRDTMARHSATRRFSPPDSPSRVGRREEDSGGRTTPFRSGDQSPSSFWILLLQLGVMRGVGRQGLKLVDQIQNGAAPSRTFSGRSWSDPDPIPGEVALDKILPAGHMSRIRLPIPARMRRKVDFPDPFRPTGPIGRPPSRKGMRLPARFAG